MAKKQNRYYHPDHILAILPKLTGKTVTLINQQGQVYYVEIGKTDGINVWVKDMKNTKHRFSKTEIAEVITEKEI